MVNTTVLTGGHVDSVICVEKRGDVLYSGGETGDLCLWDLRSQQLVEKVECPGEGCSSIALPKLHENTLYIASAEKVWQYDKRSLQNPVCGLSPSSEEEINQIVLNDKEEYLAACDDSGNIRVFSVRNSENRLFKTLRNKHTNICSTVTFRPGKPWDVLSGGFDCHLIHWDFGKLKALNFLNMQELINDETIDSVNYMLNPPFVHHMTTSPSGQLLGCGLGNGTVMVFDSSRRHLKQKYSIQGHTQGVSQIHFVTEAMFIAGSNDMNISIWDLSLGQGNHGDHVNNSAGSSNGHTANPTPSADDSLAELFLKQKIHHQHKINWLQPYLDGSNIKIIVADHRPEITIYTLP